MTCFFLLCANDGQLTFFCAGFIYSNSDRVPHFVWCKKMEHSWSYNANKLRNGMLRLFLEVELKSLACDPICFRAEFIDGDCARVPHFKWCRNTEYSWRYNTNKSKIGEKRGCYVLFWK